MKFCTFEHLKIDQSFLVVTQLVLIFISASPSVLDRLSFEPTTTSNKLSQEVGKLPFT